MTRSHPVRFGTMSLRAYAATFVVVLAFAVAACQPQQPKMSLVPPVLPEKADFATPQAAVKTYLDYTTYAYRMANSDLASQAASPYEGVRVDSYVQLNREKDRGIEQQLRSFAKRSESKVGTMVALAAKEDWRYRYFSLASKQYTTPFYDTSYETTYTLIKRPEGGWYVDKVEAKPLNEVH